MADEKYYEEKIVDIIKKWSYADRDVQRLEKALSNREDCRARIIVWLAHRFNVPRGTAEAYIDMRTGEFRSGPLMSYCLDPELKNLFSRLKEAVTTINSISFKTVSEGKTLVQNYLSQMKILMDEIRKVFGEIKAKEIATRAKIRAIKETGISF